MKYEDFLFVGLQLQKQDKVIDKLNELNVDLMDFMDPYYAIITKLIKEVYGEEGADWFSWFCYEADFGTKDWSKVPTYIQNDDGTSTKIHEAGEQRYGATDKEGNPICYSWESLWEYLENLKENK
jgi:hypothetical protein